MSSALGRRESARRSFALASVLELGRTWLDQHGDGAVLLPHHDADGLSAGALLHRRTGGQVLHLDTPWNQPPLQAAAAVLADWGVRPFGGPSELLYVDHHAEPEPVSGTVVMPRTGSDSSTSLLAWELLGRPADSAWLAALGAVGDLGRRAVTDGIAPRVASASKVARLASLVNAPGRLHEGPVDEAFALLREGSSVEAALASTRRTVLEAARAKVAQSRNRAMRVGPKLGPEAALIRFCEPARVHPLVATAWARRLSPRVVIAANEGWREGVVSFAVRSHIELDLRKWLQDRFSPERDAGDYARGHRRASGGHLRPRAFEEFAAAALR